VPTLDPLGSETQATNVGINPAARDSKHSISTTNLDS
jgi:hypothetical protein